MTTPTLAGFVAWLKEQDPNDSYIYCDSKNCAGAQYYASIGAAFTVNDLVQTDIIDVPPGSDEDAYAITAGSIARAMQYLSDRDHPTDNIEPMLIETVANCAHVFRLSVIDGQERTTFGDTLFYAENALVEYEKYKRSIGV